MYGLLVFVASSLITLDAKDKSRSIDDLVGTDINLPKDLAARMVVWLMRLYVEIAASEDCSAVDLA